MEPTRLADLLRRIDRLDTLFHLPAASRFELAVGELQLRLDRIDIDSVAAARRSAAKTTDASDSADRQAILLSLFGRRAEAGGLVAGNASNPKGNGILLPLACRPILRIDAGQLDSESVAATAMQAADLHAHACLAAAAEAAEGDTFRTQGISPHVLTALLIHLEAAYGVDGAFMALVPAGPGGGRARINRAELESNGPGPVRAAAAALERVCARFSPIGWRVEWTEADEFSVERADLYDLLDPRQSPTLSAHEKLEVALLAKELFSRASEEIEAATAQHHRTKRRAGRDLPA